MAMGTETDQNNTDKKIMDNWLLAAPVTYLLALGLSLWFFRKYSALNIVGFQVPLSVIWFGALGGVVASLQGIFFYNRKWDKSFTHWHIFSGLVGAAFGLASYLFLIVIVNSAAGTSSGNASAASSKDAVFALGAFAIGYGQSHFHAMMDRVFSVIFHPSNQAAQPQLSSGTNPAGPQTPEQPGKLEVEPIA